MRLEGPRPQTLRNRADSKTIPVEVLSLLLLPTLLVGCPKSPAPNSERIQIAAPPAAVDAGATAKQAYVVQPCSRHGLDLEFLGRHGKRTYSDQSAKFYREQCTAGSSADCRCLAHLIGNDMAEENAVLALGDDCKPNAPDSCRDLKDMLKRYGVEGGAGRDAVKGLLEKACRTNDQEACRLLAVGFATGTFGTTDYPEAFSLYEHACALNHGSACFSVGWMHQEGEGRERNLPLARSYYQRACDLGSFDACHQLAEVMRSTGAAPPDVRALYDRACAGRRPRACIALAVMDMAGPPDSKARVPQALIRACESGGAVFCLNTAAALSEMDRMLANPLYRWGCVHGAKAGCSVLAMVCPSDPNACSALEGAEAESKCLSGCGKQCEDELERKIMVEKKENAPVLFEQCTSECVRQTCKSVPLKAQ